MVMRAASGPRREPQGSPRPVPNPRPGGALIPGREGGGAASHSPHRCAPGSSTPRATPQPTVSPRYPAAQTAGATPQVRWPSHYNTRQTVPTTFHWRAGSPGANGAGSPRVIGHDGFGTSTMTEAREASATPPRPPPGEHPLPGTLASVRPAPSNIPPSRRQRSSEEIQRAARQYGQVRTSPAYDSGISRHTVPPSRWRTAPSSSNNPSSPEKQSGSSPVKTRLRSMEEQEGIGARLPGSSSSPEIHVLTTTMKVQGHAGQKDCPATLTIEEARNARHAASRTCRGEMQSQIRATVPQLNWRHPSAQTQSTTNKRQVLVTQQQQVSAAVGSHQAIAESSLTDAARDYEADLAEGDDDDHSSEVSFNLSPIRTREAAAASHSAPNVDQQVRRQQVADPLRSHGQRVPQNHLHSPQTQNMSPRPQNMSPRNQQNMSPRTHGPRRSSVASSTLSRLSSTSDSSDAGIEGIGLAVLDHETSTCSSSASGIQEENRASLDGSQPQTEAAPQKQNPAQPAPMFKKISPRKKDLQSQSPARGRMNEMRSGRVNQMRSMWEQKITGASRERRHNSASGERCESPVSRERRQTAPTTPTMRRLSEASQSEPSLTEAILASKSLDCSNTVETEKRAVTLEPESQPSPQTLDHSKATSHSEAQKSSASSEARLVRRIARQRRAFDAAAQDLQTLLQQQFGQLGSDPESESSNSSGPEENTSWQQNVEHEIANLYKTQAKMLRLVTKSFTVRPSVPDQAASGSPRLPLRSVHREAPEAPLQENKKQPRREQQEHGRHPDSELAAFSQPQLQVQQQHLQQQPQLQHPMQPPQQQSLVQQELQEPPLQKDPLHEVPPPTSSSSMLQGQQEQNSKPQSQQQAQPHQSQTHQPQQTQEAHQPQEPQEPQLQEQQQLQPEQANQPKQQYHGSPERDCSEFSEPKGENAHPSGTSAAAPQRSPSPAPNQHSNDEAGTHASAMRTLTRTESPLRLRCVDDEVDVDEAKEALEEVDESLEEKQTLDDPQAISHSECELRRVSSPTRKRSQEADMQQSASSASGQSGESQVPAADTTRILHDELESDTESVSEEEDTEQEAVDEPMNDDETYVCASGSLGMPRELTQLHQLETQEMFQAVKVRMPEGTRPGQKIAFTYAKRQHEATVDESQLASDSAEALFTVCAKRPPLDRNAHYAGVRGRLNVHCGYDRHHISEVLRQPPTIPQNSYTYNRELDGIVVKSQFFAERNLLYKYLMGKNMDPILPNTQEEEEDVPDVLT